jgi:pilus assembly protein Flp/PilA
MTKLMTKLQREFGRFSADDRAATAVEYAIIAVGIAVVIVVAVTGIGSSVKASFTSASNGFN